MWRDNLLDVRLVMSWSFYSRVSTRIVSITHTIAHMYTHKYTLAKLRCLWVFSAFFRRVVLLFHYFLFLFHFISQHFWIFIFIYTGKNPTTTSKRVNTKIEWKNTKCTKKNWKYFSALFVFGEWRWGGGQRRLEARFIQIYIV